MNVLSTTAPSATVGTWAVTFDGSDVLGGSFFNSSAAQNDSVAYKVLLTQGTWTVKLLYNKNTNSGIATISLGSVSVGTLDCWAAAINRNNVQTFTGIAIPSTGIYALTYLMATKNASATAFGCGVVAASLLRTA